MLHPAYSIPCRNALAGIFAFCSLHLLDKTIRLWTAPRRNALAGIFAFCSRAGRRCLADYCQRRNALAGIFAFCSGTEARP